MALLSLFSSLFGKSRNVRAIHRREIPAIEILEQRIAPASLINGRTVEFTDADGDSVTITASKAIFKAGTVNKILQFDTGGVDGNSNTEQQLQLVNISKIKGAGLSLTIDSTAAGLGNGFVDVGFVNARNRDIGTVDIDGDLGRYVAGKRTGQTLGTQALIVESIGARGITTQDAGGTLETIVAGGLGQLTVNGDIVGATVNVGGAVGTDRIGQINIAGSLIGGTTASSGVIRAQGEIGPITIGGDIRGGTADETGQIGSTARVGAVALGGSIVGGVGLRSGALLSTGELAQVTIQGSIQGGLGINSGTIGSASSIVGVSIQGSLLGGRGQDSGAILSGGGIGFVNVLGDIQRDLTSKSAAIGAGGVLGDVTIGNRLQSEIIAGASVGRVTVGGTISQAEVRTPGSIAAITVNSDLSEVVGIVLSVFNAGRDIGPITVGRHIFDSVFVAGSYFSGSLSTLGAGYSPSSIGFDSLPHTDFAGPSSIGAITVASVAGDNTAIVESSFFAGVSGLDSPPPNGGTIGPVTADTGVWRSSFVSGSLGALTVAAGRVQSVDYFATDASATGKGIGAISVTAPSNMSSAITTSNFVSAQQIGAIEALLLNGGGGEFSTPIGAISESNFTAATTIASIFAQAIITPGVDSSKFTAGTGIGNVTAISQTNYGFSDTLVRSGGNLGTVSATSTFGGDAIFFSGFNARGSIAGVDATGNISVSAFIAGIDLGADFTVTPINISEELILFTSNVRSEGVASSNLTIQTSAFGAFGFGGTGSEADTVGTGNISIGPVILGGANDSSSSIHSSTFLGGVTSLGADGFVGTDDDVVLAGARIESITADGTVDSSRFKSAAIGNTEVRGIFSTLYQAIGGAVGEIDAFGGIASSQIQGTSIGKTTVGNGRISNTNYLSTGTGTDPGIADITVNWNASGTFGGAAISQSNFTSGTTIANVSATVTGIPSAGSASAISVTEFNAHRTIGDITGRNNATVFLESPVSALNALALVTVRSGISGPGGIGNITATIADPLRSGSAIHMGTFDAGSGNIASITATALNADGIVSAIFRAGGTIGDITASTTGFASSGSVFSAGTSIGNVKLTGDLRDVRVLAGYDIGTDMVYGNEDLSPTSTAMKVGAKVGTVTTVGLFERVDIISSVNPGADYNFGGSDDTIVGTGGSIGLIDITVGKTFFVRPDGFGNAGVEATAFADSDPMVPGTQIVINGNTVTLPLLLGPDGSSTRFVVLDGKPPLS